MYEIQIIDMRTRGQRRSSHSGRPTDRRIGPIPIADVLPTYIEELQRRCNHTWVGSHAHVRSHETSRVGAQR